MKRLSGQKILVTREHAQAHAFSRLIALAGGIPLEVPLLCIRCSERLEDKPLWDRLDTYKWLFFTSANGVDCFISQLRAKDLNRNSFPSAKIAAVGHKTEQALKAHGLSADFVPTIYDAETLAHEFLRKHPRPGAVLLVRGSRSRDVLPVEFTKENIAFDSLETYETAYNMDVGDKLLETLAQHHFSFLTFTSPSSIEAFIELGGKPGEQTAAISCIGTTTADKAEKCGFSNILVPDVFTIEGMIQAMEQYEPLERTDIR